jgi:hypothetical protein
MYETCTLLSITYYDLKQKKNLTPESTTIQIGLESDKI